MEKTTKEDRRVGFPHGKTTKEDRKVGFSHGKRREAIVKADFPMEKAREYAASARIICAFLFLSGALSCSGAGRCMLAPSGAVPRWGRPSWVGGGAKRNRKGGDGCRRS